MQIEAPLHEVRWPMVEVDPRLVTMRNRIADLETQIVERD